LAASGAADPEAENVDRFGFYTSGVRFFVFGQERPFIFWHFHPEEVLKALEARHVAVDYAPHTVSLWGT